MVAPNPTKREIVLVSLLLASVLILFRTKTYVPPSSIWTAAEKKNHSNHGSTVPPAILETRVLRNLDTRLSWGSSQVPSTKILAHVPGWTIFDKLYILNGTIFVVSDEPEKTPDIKFMYSKAIPIEPGALAEASRLPSDNEIRVISTKEAKQYFGTGAQMMDGVTWLVNDPPQFITHYYHWSAELWFGFWRTYSTLDTSISSNGSTTLPPPRRLSFNHLDGYHWRDYAAMDQWAVRSSFPSITMEFTDDWRDRAEMSCPFVFERVVLADRSAAMLAYNYARYQRTASVPYALPGSVNWWMTIRNNVIQFTGLKADVGGGTTSKPVITYISRQSWGRRMLIQADHEKLVRELYKLRDNYGYEVNVVSMDKLSRIQQLQLAARTTIMMGVHGNGLTSLIWMKPSPRSTVIEFFFPGGFAYDYEYTTRAIGMVHYGFWGSESFTSPGVPLPAYPKGFQGNSIPIDGEAVARLCIERLTLAVEADD